MEVFALALITVCGMINLFLVQHEENKFSWPKWKFNNIKPINTVSNCHVARIIHFYI